MNGHILLSSGEQFNLLKPDPDMITIEVVASALSKLCRYNGHVKRFYSVAEHCCLVSVLAPQAGDGHAGYALDGLLHDATEAFVGDMVSPLKRMVPKYQKIEAKIERAIDKAFGTALATHAAAPVKAADLEAFAFEVRSLMPGGLTSYPEAPTPRRRASPWKLGWDPERAEEEFLARYEELTEEDA